MQEQVSTKSGLLSSHKFDTRRTRRGSSASESRKSQSSLVQAAIAALARIGVQAAA